MKLFNSVSGCAAAFAVMSACICCCTAYADYEAPADISVSVGHYEIDRSQLSGDTLVEVPVYINNNCGFVSLNVIFELDERLRFSGDCEAGTNSGKLAGVNIYKCSDSGNTISTCFEAAGRSRFTSDGELGYLRVIIPEGTPAGDYGISMRDSAGDFETMIFTYNSNDAMFGRECFSDLAGGSITVSDTSADMSVPQSDSNQQEGNSSNDVQPSGDNSEQHEEDKAAAVTTAAADKATETASSTITVTTTSVTVSTTDTSITTGTEKTVSTNAVTETTVTSDGTEDMKKGKNRNMLAPIIAATLIIIGAAVAFVFKKGGRSK